MSDEAALQLHPSHLLYSMSKILAKNNFKSIDNSSETFVLVETNFFF